MDACQKDFRQIVIPMSKDSLLDDWVEVDMDMEKKPTQLKVENESGLQKDNIRKQAQKEETTTTVYPQSTVAIVQSKQSTSESINVKEETEKTEVERTKSEEKHHEHPFVQASTIESHSQPLSSDNQTTPKTAVQQNEIHKSTGREEESLISRNTLRNLIPQYRTPQSDFFYFLGIIVNITLLILTYRSIMS